jgi:hypothetical protein
MKSDSIGKHEIKFVTKKKHAQIIIQWLERRCRPDPKFPAGIISSIYYDTRDWGFLNEKINSDFHKTKIRLRWYSDIDTGEPGDISYIEAKFKIGSRREKVRIKTKYSGKWLANLSLSDQSLIAIPNLLRSNTVTFYKPIFPVFTIRYKRKRFVELVTGARLCLDYDISVPSVNYLLMPRVNPVSLQSVVFEIKGAPTELPDSIRHLMTISCRKSSFSKYATCFQHLMRINL